jgi:hypothetical protein
MTPSGAQENRNMEATSAEANVVLMAGYEMVEKEFKPEKYQLEPPLAETERAFVIEFAERDVYRTLVTYSSLDFFNAAETIHAAIEIVNTSRRAAGNPLFEGLLDTNIGPFKPSEWKMKLGDPQTV